MKITCPHCSQILELTPDVLAALQGQPHFACPMCEELMAVPAVEVADIPAKQAYVPDGNAVTSAEAAKPSLQTSTKKKSKSPLVISGVGVILAIAAGCFFFVGSTTTQPALATKGRPFLNTLGMKFVPIPGTDVLFCIHETRYQDYLAYATDAHDEGGIWRNQNVEGFTPKENPESHPVMKVSWDDAQKFCAWLSQKEGKTYRLPTDQEWSIAVGIAPKETRQADTTPATINKSPTDFPWGDQWPPPEGSGNYSDQSRKTEAPYIRANDGYLDGYNDGFPTTSPVMSFKPNILGVYDLEGNVREWCEDWYDSARKNHVLRGGCWHIASKRWLISGLRASDAPGRGHISNGFRVVLDLAGSTDASSH
ncbi:MAG: SUMF1/EgtB/PvdO family nonheme iron enzyme [Verrucomicrobiales bacterium]|nr:SUMF1/EgtB/PvdO family nonheme iron enzyme [Verrucomicrobiales bacterium]